MDTIKDDERELIGYALEKLVATDDVTIYGEPDPTACERAGAISFNIRGMSHGLTAAVLNDYFNISVRNECFCAHPYVREMITEALADEDEEYVEQIASLSEARQGMVRASFGIYTTREDVDALAIAVKKISDDREMYTSLYDPQPNGDYRHKTFKFNPAQAFSVRGAVDAWLTDTTG